MSFISKFNLIELSRSEYNKISLIMRAKLRKNSQYNIIRSIIFHAKFSLKNEVTKNKCNHEMSFKFLKYLLHSLSSSERFSFLFLDEILQQVCQMIYYL